MGNYQLIGLITAKNDAWYLQRSLPRLAECVDGIVAVDDGSTDETYDIFRACPKVIEVIRNAPGRRWDIFRDGERMMRAVQQAGAEWLMYIDSDDVVDRRFVEQRSQLLSAPAVGRYHFREITLWRDTQHYRADKPNQWSRRRDRTPYLVKVAPTWKLGDPYSTKLTSQFVRWASRQWVTAWLRRRISKEVPMSPHLHSILWPNDLLNYTNLRPVGSWGREVEIQLVKLHYHYANWELAWRKHMNYALQAAIQQLRAPGEIPMLVDWASKNFDETGIDLRPVDPLWGAVN